MVIATGFKYIFNYTKIVNFLLQAVANCSLAMNVLRRITCLYFNQTSFVGKYDVIIYNEMLAKPLLIIMSSLGPPKTNIALRTLEDTMHMINQSSSNK